MLNTNNPILNSFSQASYELVTNLLEEYRELNPSFKYKLYFGSNYNEECNDDEFGIYLEIGTLDKIPAHYTNINGVDTLLFAGTTTFYFNVVNPISTQYLNEPTLSYLHNVELTDDFLNQAQENTTYGEEDVVLDDMTVGKIQDSVRLLEGLSLFLQRKCLVFNNFEFTLVPDIPIIVSEFEEGLFRLVEEINVPVKYQDISTFYIDSGESCRVLFNFGTDEQPKWEELYGLVDFSFSYGAQDNTFAQVPHTLVQNILNQMDFNFQASTVAISNMGANKKIKELVYSCDISALQDVPMKFTEDNGRTWKKTVVNIKTMTLPKNINLFGSNVYLLQVLEPITQFEGD